MRRCIAREMMDDDEATGTAALWRQSLDDLARVNTWLGGWHALRSELERLPRPPTSVVDVATGGADLPERMLDHLARRGVRARCVAVDRSARILGLAQAMRLGCQRLTFVQADARQLPFADHSFDVATCNLALHHFDPPEAIQVLRELARVGRAVIVNDLRRQGVGRALERQSAGEQLVEDDAQAVDVATGVGRVTVSGGLLGRHVRQRTKHPPV